MTVFNNLTIPTHLFEQIQQLCDATVMSNINTLYQNNNLFDEIYAVKIYLAEMLKA
jgi:hypothetical protein